MSVFYNRNIDQIAMRCPICDKANEKLDRLSKQDLERYENHLRVKHGLVR